MITRDDDKKARKNTFDALERIKQRGSIPLSVQGVMRLFNDPRAFKKLLKSIENKKPLYLKLFDFPNMTDLNTTEEVHQLLSRFLAANIVRLHLEITDFSEDDCQSLAEHFIQHLTKVLDEGSNLPTMPDITCDAGEKKKTIKWNTLNYNLSNQRLEMKPNGGSALESTYEPLMALASALYELDRFDRCQVVYGWAFEVAKNDKQRGEVLFLRGDLCLETKRKVSTQVLNELYSQAIVDLQAAQKFLPSNDGVTKFLSRAFHFRGILLEGLGEYKKAANDYLQAIVCVPRGDIENIDEINERKESCEEKIPKLHQRQKVSDKISPARIDKLARPTVKGSEPKAIKGSKKRKPANDPIMGGPGSAFKAFKPLAFNGPNKDSQKANKGKSTRKPTSRKK